MSLPVMQTPKILRPTSYDKPADRDERARAPRGQLRPRQLRRSHHTKVPRVMIIMIQAMIINKLGTLFADEKRAVCSLELPPIRDGRGMRWSGSNHTIHVIDPDDLRSASKPSQASDAEAGPPSAGLGGYEEDYQEALRVLGPDYDDEDDDEDDDDFYRTNPADPMSTSGPDKQFRDFDDLDALGLRDFYGGTQADVDNTPVALPASHDETAIRGRARPVTGSGSAGPRAKRKPPDRPRDKRARKLARTRAGHRPEIYAEVVGAIQKLLANESSDGLAGQKTNASNVTAPSNPLDAPRLAASSDQGEQATPFGDPVGRCALISRSSGVCIDYAAVEVALHQARRLIEFRRPPGLGSLEPTEATVHAVGELTEWASRLLAMRFGLTSEEVADSMDQIDVSQTSLWRHCPRLFRTPWARQCYNHRAAAASDLQYQDMNQMALMSGRYRSVTGQCNNPVIQNLGSSFMPFVRLNTPEYGDGVGSSRRPRSGLAELPPARLVSLVLHSSQLDMPSSDLSAMLFAWGQLINHDLALASGARVATGHGDSCCTAGTRASQVADPLGRVCMPIHVGATDPVYASYGVRCLDFKRSIAGLRPGCSLGPRTQMNLVSSFVDGSFVYGSTRSWSNSLRLNSAGRGQMAVWDYFGQTTDATGATVQRKPLLPPQLDQPDDECLGRRGGLYCFRSGDLRTNQQVPLVVLHTVHTRQHNRIAETLCDMNPHWSSERIFQEARHIHIAQVQHILMREYLPLILGPKTRLKFGLDEAADGHYWDHYEASLVPGISQEFAAAAFRQGHSTVASEVYRVDVASRMPSQVYKLRELFRQPWPVFEPGAVDEFLLGLTESASREMDPFVSRELGGHLLQEPSEPVGLDLIAINIQRGRDQGVASYNSMRDWCGLGRLETLGDLVLAVGNYSAQMMMQLYESIDDIDLYSGGLSELPVESSGLLGPTFSCIVAHQFSLLRRADRYWYESSGGPHAFTPEQLASIKETTLARIICANSDQIWTIQPLAMRLPHPIYNPPVRCQDLPELDMRLWYEFSNQPQQAAASEGR